MVAGSRARGNESLRRWIASAIVVVSRGIRDCEEKRDRECDGGKQGARPRGVEGARGW